MVPFNKQTNPTLITQVTAFSGRKFCLESVIKGIESNCDPDETHFIWLDNSRDEWFNRAILAYLSNKPNATLIIDNTPQIDINKYVFADEKQKTDALIEIGLKITNTYQACFNQIRPESQITWVVEDDVVVPKDALVTLYKTMRDLPEIGTVIGRMLDRRAHEHGGDFSVISDYTINQRLGVENKTQVDVVNILNGADVPKFGVQLVGTGHMGCWLTKSQLIRDLGMKVVESGCLGCDNNWGWRIYKHNGSRVAVNWNVHCQHHYRDSQGNIRIAS